MRLKSVFRRVTRKLAAMNATFRFALLELPTELIAQIIEHVDSRTTLKHLACTCRKIQELTEPVLYRSALIRDAVQMTNMLHSVVGNRPARAKAIHHLDVPCHPRSSPSFDDLGVLLENALNLRRLMVESPECNTGEFEDEDSYEHMARNLFRPFESAVCVNDVERRPLQRLQERKSVPDKRCEDCLAFSSAAIITVGVKGSLDTALTNNPVVLHLNGKESPYWTIGRRCLSIFLLPSLQKLTLSCVNIEDDVVESIRDRSFTSLKHLTLEESNITHQGLIGILSLPKALETLYLGQLLSVITAMTKLTIRRRELP